MAPDQHRITLPDALVIVQRARATPPKQVHGWSIGAEIIKEILDQDGAGLLRVYLGAREDGVATVVFLATDAQGRDMTEGTIAEFAYPCPPMCDAASPFAQP